MISLLVNGIHKAMEQERRDGQIDYTVCMTFYRRLKQKLGLKYAVYSMDKHPDDIIALGAFRFYSSKRYTNSKSDFLSKPYVNPTYRQAFIEFENCIIHAGDYHHIYLEDVIIDDSGIDCLRFVTGS